MLLPGLTRPPKAWTPQSLLLGGEGAFSVLYCRALGLECFYVPNLLLISLLLITALSSVAGTDSHFLQAIGSFTLRDSTNQVSVTARLNDDNTNSILISWPGYDSTVSDLPPGEYTMSNEMPICAKGWFVFAQDATHIWVFDGVSLQLVTFLGKNQTDTVMPLTRVDKSWPKEVREALPLSCRKG
jgi:hypothetical protein